MNVRIMFYNTVLNIAETKSRGEPQQRFSHNIAYGRCIHTRGLVVVFRRKNSPSDSPNAFAECSRRTHGRGISPWARDETLSAESHIGGVLKLAIQLLFSRVVHWTIESRITMKIKR